MNLMKCKFKTVIASQFLEYTVHSPKLITKVK